MPRRLSSVGRAPTKGEFAIMQKLGENNYYVMKKLRGSQPLKANRSQTGTNFLLHPKTANSSSIKFSRPVTSTTKPNTIKVHRSTNNRSSLATSNKFRETNINQSMGSLLQGSNQASKSGKVLSSVHAAWYKGRKTPSQLLVEATQKQQEAAMKTIEPVRFQSSLLERQEIKNTLHDQISKIRESCSYALELDIDAMIEANEPVGWELPQGFLEHVELSQLESSWEKTVSRK